MDFPPKYDDERESVVETILDRIASAEGVDQSDLSPPLYEATDPDALDRLVANTAAPLTVTFTYGDWTVKVRGGPETEVTIESDAE